MFYDVKFGRKRETSGEDADANGKDVANGSVALNGNGHLKNTSDMAVYEQYRSQVVCVGICEVKMPLCFW